jgi:hypothetical protein
MRDFGEYLRAYGAYISANLGWGKALRFALVWLAGMFAPLAARTLLELPNWVAITWMIAWAFLGYIFALTECGNIIALKLRAQVSQTENSRRRRSSARLYAPEQILQFFEIAWQIIVWTCPTVRRWSRSLTTALAQ